VVATAKDMAIDLKEVECLLAYPKEFVVLVAKKYVCMVHL
jgi:hypothetical protein